ncbi:Crp/Fnr family transcriptional regulator [Belliella marina]|uniref:Crp/Fnr family transcriptional regulator n=1 Tax=Belliella marina TaxID=1644146 RepID=A0ABW4VJQ7_9BACT
MPILKSDCQSCHNDHCIIKKNRHLAQMKSFIDRKSMVQCKKGQNLIIEGAPVHGLYFVMEGKVKVAKTGLNGKEQIVRMAGNGEIIGHRGFGVGQFYQISAVSLEDTILCNFSNTEMKEMLLTIPSLTYDLMIFYAEELNRSETKVKKFAQMTVREKIIDAILYINRKFGQHKGFLNLQLSRKEIADFAGTTDEQVIRTISSLKKEGLILAAGKKIGIKNVNILSKEISEHNHFLDS